MNGELSHGIASPPPLLWKCTWGEGTLSARRDAGDETNLIISCQQLNLGNHAEGSSMFLSLKFRQHFNPHLSYLFPSNFAPERESPGLTPWLQSEQLFFVMLYRFQSVLVRFQVRCWKSIKNEIHHTGQ